MDLQKISRLTDMGFTKVIKPGASAKIEIGDKEEKNEAATQKLYDDAGSHPRLNLGVQMTCEAVVPGIQEHRKCVQLNPEKGYLIVK